MKKHSVSLCIIHLVDFIRDSTLPSIQFLFFHFYISTKLYNFCHMKIVISLFKRIFFHFHFKFHVIKVKTEL